ncbi:MAG: hypothetical protein MR210_02240, partial [Erysipelotrichaceae bacterium]|nr:hypothetical protein [Erysipelotrichaceae bacterium]
MIKINNIKCPLDQKLSKALIAKKISCNPNEIISYEIERESLDARFEQPYYVYNCIACLQNEKKYLKLKDVTIYHKEDFIFPTAKKNAKVAVIGFGPSGIFAALTLAKAGLKPVVFERGEDVDNRVISVENFWKHNQLNPNSNVQYGEGGAGTFSDGKLTCRIKDPRVKVVLDELVAHGAKPSIRYEHLPHIGTDKLRNIIKNIREELISLGATIKFNTLVKDFKVENGRIVGIYADRYYDFDYVILCCGHSSIDTFKALKNKHIYIEQKDFAVGVRVEHPQQLININQNKQHYQKLEAASYRLTYKASNGRSVYSFCMCPGGIVVNSASEKNTIVTNGMSNSARDEINANSALLVQVFKEDYESDDVLAGFAYQQKIEAKTFALTNSYAAPVQNIQDYLNKQVNPLVIPTSFTNGYQLRNLHEIFPPAINQALKEAMYDFDKKIPGFIVQGIMIASETRSSCPIRIKRNEKHESINTHNLYPCGEGAGYA